MIVGLTGYAGSGKDAAGAVLVERGWTRVAFADPLKEIALAIGWNGEKDRAGRQLLQNLGQAVRASLSEDAWVRAAERRIKEASTNVVVTDIRYHNEAEMVRSLGGRVFQIARPGVGPANGHASETNVDTLPVDDVIWNDGSLGDLRDEMLKRFTDIFTRYADA